MEALKILGLAIELELKTSECYEKLSLLAEDEPLKNELRNLAKEEIVHANLLKTGKSLGSSGTGEFGRSYIPQEEIEDNLARIGRLIESIAAGTITLADAIREIHDMEIMFEQVHLQTLLEIRDPALQKLFRALSTQDHEHRQRLEMILQSL
jgi:rubrerythrin